MLAGGADPASNPDATSKKKLSTVDRTIKSCGANAVVIDLYLLSDDGYKRVINIWIKLSAPVVRWSPRASRDTRSVTSTQEWFKQEVLSGLTDCNCEILSVLEQDDFMTECGFHSVYEGDTVVYDDNEIAYEDELAEIAGSGSLSLFRNRVRRTLFMKGLPQTRGAIPGSPSAHVTEKLQDFKLQRYAFNAFKLVPGPDKVCQ